MLTRGKMSGGFNQPLLSSGVGAYVLSGLKNGSGVGKRVADGTDDKRFKGSGRNSLAFALGSRRSFQQ